MLFIAEIQQGRCQRLKIWENTGQYPELKFANVAQWQSSGFVNQGLSVRMRPFALQCLTELSIKPQKNPDSNTESPSNQCFNKRSVKKSSPKPAFAAGQTGRA